MGFAHAIAPSGEERVVDRAREHQTDHVVSVIWPADHDGPRITWQSEHFVYPDGSPDADLVLECVVCASKGVRNRGIQGGYIAVGETGGSPAFHDAVVDGGAGGAIVVADSLDSAVEVACRRVQGGDGAVHVLVDSRPGHLTDHIPRTTAAVARTRLRHIEGAARGSRNQDVPVAQGHHLSGGPVAHQHAEGPTWGNAARPHAAPTDERVIPAGVGALQRDDAADLDHVGVDVLDRLGHALIGRDIAFLLDEEPDCELVCRLSAHVLEADVHAHDTGPLQKLVLHGLLDCTNRLESLISHFITLV